MSRLVVGPFNRVEGDLEVRLETVSGEVKDAHVVSPLYRGFERMLIGKAPDDALVFAPRICGICSVSQSVAAAHALGEAQNVAMPKNGELAINLVHAVENIADHLSHFYLFFMPDFAREVYKSEKWYDDIAERFVAIKGSASQDVLPARAKFLHLLGILAGKWPHTLSIRPGGSTRSISAGEIAQMQGIIAGFRHFAERFLYGDAIEHIAMINSQKALFSWADEKPQTQSDFRRFIALGKALKLETLGPGPGRLMSYGAYKQGDGHLFARGVFENGKSGPLDPGMISEDVSHAWYVESEAQDKNGLALFEGSTIVDGEAVGREDEKAYSWCKAPRLGGKVVETGAIARQTNHGNELIVDMVKSGGSNVFSRVVARVTEIAHILLAMEAWLEQIEIGEAFCAQAKMPDKARGIGLTEAARGSLGHWLVVENGEIANYQIVAPTTWNFSPRDDKNTPGPLEQALVGAPIKKGETEPVSVQHIVRSFDPCLVCTVH